MIATLFFGRTDANLAATEHPPVPPPTTTSLKLLNKRSYLNTEQKLKRQFIECASTMAFNIELQFYFGSFLKIMQIRC
jgi:hypothetical protein